MAGWRLECHNIPSIERFEWDAQQLKNVRVAMGLYNITPARRQTPPHQGEHKEEEDGGGEVEVEDDQ